MLSVHARPLHRCERLIPLVEKKNLFDERRPIRQKVQSSAVLRKLCQPGVYVLVCVVVSLYVIVIIVFMTCT